jgi:hypothetical protein
MKMLITLVDFVSFYHRIPETPAPGQGWEWQPGAGEPLGELPVAGDWNEPDKRYANPGETNQLSPMYIGGQPVKAA